MPSNKNNRILIPEAREGLHQLRNEVATEVGIHDYNNVDKGNLSSRQNGSVGGEMVRRMVESYEQGLKR